jgi:hypothetical protein
VAKKVYNSFSLGLVQSIFTLFTLPDLKHRQRNSLCNLRDIGSENQSYRLGQILNKASSNSNQTTPHTGNSFKHKSQKAAPKPEPSKPDFQMGLHQLYKGAARLPQPMAVTGIPITPIEEVKFAEQPKQS